MNQRRARGDAQPFDQRFLLFMLASLTILLFFNPGRPAVEDAQEQNAQQQEAEAAANPDAVGEEQAPDVAEAAASDEAPAAALEESPPAEPALASLGAVDPQGAHRLLMTLDNVGAAVRRIELASDSYRDLENRSGYLGRLAATNAPRGGARVGVVGAGTPAAVAGLEPGDVIRSAKLGATAIRPEGKVVEVVEADDLVRVLDQSKPNQTIALNVERRGENLDLQATLSRQPLNLIRPEAENVRLHSPELARDYESVSSFLFRLRRVGARDKGHPDLIEANRRLVEEAWTVETPSADEVVFRMRLPDLSIECFKRYRLEAAPTENIDDKGYPAYHFDLDVGVRNLGSESQYVSYELAGPNGLPIEGYWYAHKIGRGWGSYGLRDVVVRFVNQRFEQYSTRTVLDDDVEPMGQGKPLAFVGVDAQYFASIVIPQKPNLTDVRLETVRAELATAPMGDKALDTWENASCVLERAPVDLPAGATLTDDYRVFAGPKLPALLEQYRVNDDAGHTLDSLLYYGWFGPVARLMLVILHFFNSLVGNYGLAIIMLTVVVRGSLYPLSRQQAKNMLMMQQLKPELDRLAKKYKDDMQKRSQAQQELFRKHNYNPAAGCLPMFLQLPIFLGLYRALSVDVELRQAPLISDSIRFCSNLAAPDMFYDWSWFMPHFVNTGQGMLGLGPYFNLLPIATIFLFILQQKMFMPPATDEQTRLQQKMMQYMMIFMGLLFFKVPSGLCIYFIASSLWGIVERKMLPKAKPVTEAVAADTVAEVTAPKPNGEAIAKARKRAKAKKKKR